MISIYDYLDYRKFLSDWFDESKKRNSFVSYRYVSGKVHLDASFLVKVFQGAGFEDFVKAMRGVFARTLVRKPGASRDRSSEVYLLGAGKLE